MKVLEGFGPNRNRVVVSLCDYSGNWPRPWHEAGHTVLLYDLKHGDDVTETAVSRIGFDVWNTLRPAGDGSSIRIECVLAAPLCTAFTSAAALHWARHDADGTTETCVNLANACVDLIEALAPRVWALENPRGRIAQLVPRLAAVQNFEFNPCDFAGYLHETLLLVTAEDPVEKVMASNRYTKRTRIWGRYVWPARKHVAPIVYTTATGKSGGVVWAKLGGKSDRTKEIRSMTPMGFARAFHSANGCG
jgi:hypothetical protein